MSVRLFPQICFNAEGAAGAAEGGDDGAAAAAAAATSGGEDGQSSQNGSNAAGDGFFKEDVAKAEAGDGGQDGGGEQGDEGASERPEWLKTKYKTVEDQAKAYNDLYSSYSKKTDTLRAEIFDDAVKEYGKTMGVPEDISEYGYPEGFEAPKTEVDEAFRMWAQKNNINGKAFEGFVSDVWALTQPNMEAEIEALGENVEARVDSVNKWIGKNVNEQHFGAVKSLMTSAAGVEFLESMMDSQQSGEHMPSFEEFNQNRTPLTRASIREKQADPRYRSDTAYRAYVSGLWNQYGNLPPEKRQ